jgi:hypothetical protein
VVVGWFHNVETSRMEMASAAFGVQYRIEQQWGDMYDQFAGN